MNTIVSTAETTLLERVTEIFPLVRDAEEIIENERRMPAEITDALYECGMYRAFLPKELGGLEAHPVEWLEAVEALSHVNGSAGWLCMLHTGQTWAGKDAMRRILEDERWIIAGNGGRAGGVARAVEGGYWVSGRWPFSSGSPEATHLFGLCVLHDDNGEVVLSPKDGTPWFVVPYFRREDVTLHDTWDGLGLRGTGSGDFSVDEEVFVPADMVDERGIWGITYGTPHEKGPFIQAAHSAHALGLATAALEELIKQTHLKARRGSYRQLRFATDENLHIAIARSDARIRASRLLQNDVISRAFESAQNNRFIDYELRVLMAEINTFIVHECRDIVNTLFVESGVGGVGAKSRLARIFRDMAVAANHIIIAQNQLPSVGAYWMTRDMEDGPFIDNIEMSAIYPPHPQFADRANIRVDLPTRKRS
ncbi:acyl-CoA dehydrogenase family protein [Microbacterium sp. LWO12-1.2]|uniref:acyl-CoA dehydrogenase family protein n=1 Tax=Microbacterium sp. LWO12-1.2 TaxID=3135261 RepID=UPI0034260A79